MILVPCEPKKAVCLNRHFVACAHGALHFLQGTREGSPPRCGGAQAAQGQSHVQLGGCLFLFAILKQDGVGKYCSMGFGFWNFSPGKGSEAEASRELPKLLV